MRKKEISLKLSRAVLVLSKNDSKVFFAALDSPPKANQKLKSAFANHKLRIG